MHSLIITAFDVQEIVRRIGPDAVMDQLIERFEHAFVTHDPDRVQIPVRDGFAYNDPVSGLVEWMPCMESGDRVSLKVVGYHPGNPGRAGLPTILSTASVYDATTGHLMYMMDTTFLTALRTGAASAVASKVLAIDGAVTLGLIGAGVQAVTQAHAVSRVRNVDRILFYDKDPLVASSFARRLETTLPGFAIEAAESANQVAEQSDILCTATSVSAEQGPVFTAAELKPWIHINAVGSDFPGKIEIPAALLRQATVIPDFREQAVHEGECQQLTAAEIGPELFALMQHPGSVEALTRGRTVFDSTGWALEDHVGMQLIVEYAEGFGLGTQIEVESVSTDPHDPYAFLASAEVTIDIQR